MIHSKEKSPSEIVKFCNEYKKIKKKTNNSSSTTTPLKELIKNGVKIVIYANHLLRSSYPAMVKTAKLILKNKRSLEAEKSMMSTVKRWN